MSRRLNKRGWYVLVSIPSDDGSQCVDVFEMPAGDFGFQHFRSDPEDQGGWTPIGTQNDGHVTATAAAAVAVGEIGWLTRHGRAQQALEDWLATLA